jgi:hypothetical protein
VPHAADLLARTDVLLRELGDDKRLAITVANRSYLALQTGDFPTAYALANEGRSLSRDTGDLANVVTADLNLSLAARSLGKLEMSTQALVEALELAREVGDPASLAEALIIAAASIVSRDPGTARALIDVADKARRDLMLELLPIEQEVHDAVQRELRGIPRIDVAVDLSEGDLPIVIDTAVGRALEALADAANHR